MVEIFNGVSVEVESPLMSPQAEYPPVDVEVFVVPVQGDQGVPGLSGAGFEFRQDTPSATWTINHGLGTKRVPTVLLDEDPTAPVWTDTEFIDLNTTVLQFPTAESGWAYI